MKILRGLRKPCDPKHLSIGTVHSLWSVPELFTERARRAVDLAHEEARLLERHRVGTEHILLGLLREKEGLAARVLGALDITVERFRAQVVRIVVSGEKVASGQIQFTPRAKKVLELALREARSLRSRHSRNVGWHLSA